MNSRFKNLLILSATILVSWIIVFFMIYKFTIANVAETQNVFNITAGKYCLHELEKNGNYTIEQAAEICLKKMRNLGPMGDMFLMDPRTKKVIWDASKDCKLSPENNYLTKDKICSLFASPESCIEGAEKMVSQKSGYFEWYFYTNPEYIYFEKFKYKDKYYVIASGGLYDEINSLFFNLLIVFLIFWALITVLHMIGIKYDRE